MIVNLFKLQVFVYGSLVFLLKVVFFLFVKLFLFELLMHQF